MISCNNDISYDGFTLMKPLKLNEKGQNRVSYFHDWTTQMHFRCYKMVGYLRNERNRVSS